MAFLRMSSFACAAVLAFVLVSGASADDVYVAVAGPMTGSNAAVGAQMLYGASAAVDDLNSSGLLPEFKIRLTVADDACDPKQAVAVANRLAADQVRLVVGHYCSSSSIPASDVYAEAGIIQISPGSTNPQLTERGLRTVFRICGRDDQQGVVAANYILEHHSKSKIAVLDDKSTAGKGIADVVASRLHDAGLQNIMRQSYMAGEKDYTALVSRMKREGIEIAYIGGYYAEIGLIVRQAAEAHAHLTVMANDPLMTGEFWAIASSAANGTLFTFMLDATKNAEAADVVARLKATKRTAEGYTLYAYAAVQAWALAVRRAGSFNALRVAKALRSQEAETVIGHVRFDAKGDNVSTGFVVNRWRDNTIERVE
ncbi:branched-chain amino acid ABC transporter substrate-binding protein [Bradyrhizobium sp. CCGUVB23]|uniref:branched-chain amino acid ABC transporter substrate-binding protein n=1 Tax=Bradyrhizobium sp. CCGUVB23 TaxID=2949630 RepID=UPI0020B285EE|nr:branched-chain amino acid ABC transporter substrate-binding protein [Bradyrhizobium sp. CCGUVB23]MCP3460644.1 branched-chain amino acid ABC transporter substrate-binding protein [Bradyrhizobium sp. CCGUVB23]